MSNQLPNFVVHNIFYNNREDKWDITTSNGQKHVFQGFENIDIISKKLWITGSLALLESGNLVSRLIPKVAVFDMIYMTLGDQQLSYNDFKILTAGNRILNICLSGTIIKYENGEQVFINGILKCLPNLKHLIYNGVPLVSVDFINTYQNIKTSKLKSVNIDMFSFIDFVLFSKFMDKNRHIQYYLEFHANSLSDKETETVKNYVQKIIDVGVTEFPPPSIEFPGQNDKQSEAFFLLSCSYDKQM